LFADLSTAYYYIHAEGSASAKDAQAKHSGLLTVDSKQHSLFALQFDLDREG
jgi:hypothetical protein